MTPRDTAERFETAKGAEAEAAEAALAAQMVGAYN